MQFNESTNLQGLVQAVEFNTMSGTAGISGNTDSLKNVTRLANNAVNSAVSIILKATGSWQWDDLNQTNFPILTGDLVADQQDYPWPGDILRIYKVEVDYDGSGRYVVAEEVDSESNLIPSDATSESAHYSTSQPKYNIIANSLFLLPRPTANVTSGIKIHIAREISKFASTDTTKEPGIDDPFHEYIEAYVTYHWEKVYHPERAEGWKRDVSELGIRLGEYYIMKNPVMSYQVKTKRNNFK